MKITFTETPPLIYDGGTLQVKVADAAHPDLFDTATVSFVFGWAEFVMCVEEPDPTGGALYVLDTGKGGTKIKGVDVGHTFWHVETSQGLKKNISLVPASLHTYIDKSWGYYPVATVFSNGTDSCPGILRIDNGHDTTVYKKYEIASLADLNSVLTYTQTVYITPGIYDLGVDAADTDAHIKIARQSPSAPPTRRG